MAAAASSAGIALLALGAALTISMSSAEAQHCEVIGCWRECAWIPGRGQCCRNVCRRRCWRAPPRYEPPVYAQQAEPQSRPRYVAPVQHWQPTPEPNRPANQPADPTAFLIVLGGAAFLLLLVVAAITSERAAVDKMHKQTDESRADTARPTALAKNAASAADEIDSYIAARLDDAYRAGRNSAGD